jgi:hypothetical protein
MKNSLKKAIKVALMLLFLNIGYSVAQPYGHSEYVNANGYYKLTKGFYYQGTTPGFIMAGYTPTSSVGSPNFVVYRTSPGGSLSGTTAWTNGYWINECATGTQVTTCLNLDLIPCNGSTYDFLAASVTKQAVFLTGINASGVPSGPITMQYNFPPNSINATQPHLLQLGNGDFIVCGSYDLSTVTHMYIIKFSSSGVPIASNTYKLAQGVSITPNDLVESPFNNYTNDELTIVGTYNDGLKDKGFLLIIDHSTWVIQQISEFSNTPTSAEGFGAITIAGGAAGTYFIHGKTNATGSSPAFKPTCMSVQPDGITTNWSYFYFANGSPFSVTPKQIIERPNTYSSVYDYFMGYYTPFGAKITKIDPNGNWFTQSSNTNYDVVYGPFNYDCQSISFNNVAGSDEGIHLYGNNSNNNFVLVQSYFNLISNPSATSNPCSGTYENIFAYSFNPTSTNTLVVGSTLNITSGPIYCGTGIGFTYETVNQNQLCGSNNSDIMGDNSKKTALNENSSHVIKIKPTIADKEISVEGKSIFNYKILQLDGKLVEKGISTGNISTVNLTDGVFVLIIADEASTFSQKIVISH